ncbi:Cobalt-zinc-cadmium resistance protein [Paramagnetospirillum magnetotacticum MS-1]|uniref:Cation-efflux pump FieF n=1 Tax=Paramagnetospirillum magnetotacticum MS-1 TaxID=272627 RepID=A0A0C2YQS8_PARME|nr:cation diffusion facilitator family transporter [Paramagnetospirillum magnetotacticum]KIL97035.1 Cobalt-zinc-cadmium resistance protein [Paramagnetospirillum magnetotacticum MS-1]
MSQATDHDRLMRLATYASTATAALLITVKLAAWLATGSVALLSTLIDSTLDLAASALNLVAVRQALVPADDDHRFGHGKAEALAGLGQAAFVVGSGGFLLAEAGSRMVHPQPVSHGEWGIAVMVFSIIATLALVSFQRMVTRRTGSMAISADSLHYTGDVLINGSVIVSLLLAAGTGWPLADPLFAIGIGGWLMINAWQIARLSLDTLMDKELPESDRARIRAILATHPQVRDHHDLKTRTSGRQGFIQLHLELAGDLSLVEAHRISDEVEKAILAEFPGFDVIIHEDPAGIREERTEFR